MRIATGVAAWRLKRQRERERKGKGRQKQWQELGQRENVEGPGQRKGPDQEELSKGWREGQEDGLRTMQTPEIPADHTSGGEEADSSSTDGEAWWRNFSAKNVPPLRRPACACALRSAVHLPPRHQNYNSSSTEGQQQEQQQGHEEQQDEARELPDACEGVPHVFRDSR